MKIAIRRAELRDAEALCATMGSPKAMAGTLQLPLPSPEMWRKRLADLPADDYLIVAEVDGRVIGNAGVHVASKSPRRRHAAGIGMSVHDEFQGKGVGSALIAAILDIADNWLGYRRLELTVYTDNAPAIALYRKHGFEVEGTLRDYAFRNGEYVDAYTMARLRTATDTKDRDQKAGRKLTKTQRKRT
jgi:putative acetyltransferase